jgi:hypothetical protein
LSETLGVDEDNQWAIRVVMGRRKMLLREGEGTGIGGDMIAPCAMVVGVV